jgi:hypothetical protein
LRGAKVSDSKHASWASTILNKEVTDLAALTVPEIEALTESVRRGEAASAASVSSAAPATSSASVIYTNPNEEPF